MILGAPLWGSFLFAVLTTVVGIIITAIMFIVSLILMGISLAAVGVMTLVRAVDLFSMGS